ncbi:hypothetical protein [Methylosinus sp. Sm6]|uniref:hypothetical protein n=1 Tax=Methylosinus sp. Sm6 TaxID=2866948 RepID=UPI001C997D28|nr:hypothetical protein [Methylosinus sp. Sm6]MBY6240549.1 hypothetical protein [Methylosinus sp. Sm6]
MTFAMTELASRPVQIGSAVRMSLALLAVIAGLSAGKALLARGLATPTAANPAPVAKMQRDASAEDRCRTVEVEIDEGYGVRGHITRRVCRKAG